MDRATNRIPVVDDDARLRALLARYLGDQGYAVDGVGDARAMDRYLGKHPVDLFILDLMLTGEDGLPIARRLRSAGEVPIIILSARGEDVDRIVGLELGADDYLARPFNPRELLARIRAVQRRRGKGGATAREGGEVRRFGPYVLDLGSHSLARGNRPVSPTRGEFALLRLLLDHPNRVLGRDLLVDWLEGCQRTPGARSIDVRVTRLRHRIEPDPANPVYLRRVRGEGYRFTPDPPERRRHRRRAPDGG